ncbi:RDD family protein [Mucilaginibacter pedocola]|uniref:RDD domain-containing protein n=1 Tax=Mucilaginibacter pedocola TaxID=1792845 RepID=A0A1S9PDY3_9SPHI|nr:RDD family protein [Mucilaginibacter pedocola]OOQ59163.1 hypothetical protein BC343_28795 [Mucilaginibacter pedocola]
MNDSYYIRENGQQTGPFTLQEMFQQHLDVDTMILVPGSDEWQEASYVSEFFEYFEAQGIYFPTEGNLASFWVRLLAYLIDSIILGFAIALLASDYLEQMATLFTSTTITVEQKMQRLQLNLLLTAVFALYNTLCESTPMRGSIGKMLCKLAVVDADGRRLSVGRALVRNFTKILWSFVLGIGYLPILWSERRQGWHDMLAKTYVIRRDV